MLNLEYAGFAPIHKGKAFCICNISKQIVASMTESEAKQSVKRKPSFSDSEIHCLIESFDCHKEILLSKFNHAPVT